MADIFDIDYEIQETNILPPTKRLPVMLAYMFAIIYALQWVRDRLLTDYKKGAVYPNWNNIGLYFRGDRVIANDKSVYECLDNLVSSPPYNSPEWMKIQDIFIGVDVRVKYNSQIIVFENALNTYFRVSTGSPQIYISTNSQTTNYFIMANSSDLSSDLVNNSQFASSWLGNAPAFVIAPNFTIFVPSALFTTLGTDAANRENNIRNFADKYKLAGMTYNVLTF